MGTVRRVPARVLVVDDSEVVRGVIRLVLERGGLQVREATDGIEAMRVLFNETVDAVLLDVEMPGLDGWDTLERIREVSQVPVCMLTAQDDELSKVRGLRGGADDYLGKPFGNQELLARVEALVRRGRAAATEQAVDVYEDPVLRVDHQQRLVCVRGDEVAVTPSEFALLAAFVRSPGVVLSADQLAEAAFGYPEAADNQVKLYLSRLRRKLGDEVEIETLRGFGYRFRAPSG